MLNLLQCIMVHRCTKLQEKCILSLFYLEQLTIPEISAALGIPSGTVKSRLHKARQELKELWQHDIEGDTA